jgi:hypothetical protein
VNKETGGGKKSGTGRGKKPKRSSSRKGGKKAGRLAKAADYCLARHSVEKLPLS